MRRNRRSMCIISTGSLRIIVIFASNLGTIK